MRDFRLSIDREDVSFEKTDFNGRKITPIVKKCETNVKKCENETVDYKQKYEEIFEQLNELFEKLKKTEKKCENLNLQLLDYQDAEKQKSEKNAKVKNSEDAYNQGFKVCDDNWHNYIENCKHDLNFIVRNRNSFKEGEFERLLFNFF